LSLLLLAVLLTASAKAASQNGVIYGTVYDFQAKPMAGVTVTLESLAGVIRETTTATDGTYSFSEVPPGSGYAVAAHRNGAILDVRTGITVMVGEEKVIFPALRAPTSEGTSQSGEADRPVSQVSVVTQPGNAQAYVDDAFKGTTSEEEGALRIENLTPGSHRLRLTLPGYKEWKKDLALSAGETLAVQAKLEATGPKPLTFPEVEEAVKNVPKKGVMKWVKEFGVDFVVTDEVEGRLRAAGADDELLLVIAKAKK
jgi:hypothetical protein